MTTGKICGDDVISRGFDESDGEVKGGGRDYFRMRAPGNRQNASSAYWVESISHVICVLRLTLHILLPLKSHHLSLARHRCFDNNHSNIRFYRLTEKRLIIVTVTLSFTMSYLLVGEPDH